LKQTDSEDIQIQNLSRLKVTGSNTSSTMCHDQKLKDMNEREEFGALVNWALNELPAYEHMYLRYKVDGQLYQTSIRKRQNERMVGKSKVKDCQEGSITYDWPEHVTYETLDEKIIAISVLRADARNNARKEGKELSEEELKAKVFPQIDWAAGLQQGNGERIVLTEAEIELINEFLQV